MNCQEFDNHIYELAADRLMDAGARRSALAHALACRDCSARLGRERMIAENLRAYAESTEEAQASPQLRQNLLAAFTEQHKQRVDLQPVVPSGPSAGAPVIAFTPRAPRRWTQVSLAAAAGLLALFAIGMFLRWRTSEPTTKPLAKERLRPNPQPTSSPNSSPTPAPAAQPPRKPAARPLRRATDNRQLVRATRSRETRVLARATAAKGTEETTAFIPLTYSGGAASDAGSMVVRVEVPRATLLSLGLPLNLERGNSHVKADLLVGDDGITRAIRFVR
jgi:hypothetical protein